jgi:hypothetical protein
MKPRINTNVRQVPTRFSRAKRFAVEPKFAPVNRAAEQSEFESLKARVLRPVLAETINPELQRYLRLAANEAAALAWTTPFPLLFLPGLLEEKASEAHEYFARQHLVQEASPLLVEG